MQGGWSQADPTTWGDFGTVTSTRSTARAIQLAGKIVF
jgi:hypothetical protein